MTGEDMAVDARAERKKSVAVVVFILVDTKCWSAMDIEVNLYINERPASG